jgi:hypothetical protein
MTNISGKNNGAAAAPAIEDEAKERVSEAFDRLKTCKSEWEAVAGKARVKLWALLASVYAFHEAAAALPDTRDRIIGLVKNMPAYSKTDFKPETKSDLDLLVFYAVGADRDTASSRSQYTSCIESAISDPSVEATERSFLAWLKRKKGIVNSISKKKKADPALGGVAVPFSFDKFRDHMSRMSGRRAVAVVVDPAKDTYEGFTVLFAKYDPDAPQYLQLVETIGDEKIIRSVATAVARQRVKNLSPEEKNAIQHDQHLWALNRVALKLAKRLPGNVTWEDAERWQDAHGTLEGHDGRKHELFEGLTRVKFHDPSGLNDLSLNVENDDYHTYDPGRYIPLAKKGALAPYDLEALDTPEGKKALQKYIDDHLDPYIYTPAPEITEDIGPGPTNADLTTAASFDVGPKPTKAKSKESEKVE